MDYTHIGAIQAVKTPGKPKNSCSHHEIADRVVYKLKNKIEPLSKLKSTRE